MDCVRAQNGPPKIWLFEKDAGYDPPDIFTFQINIYPKSNIPNNNIRIDFRDLQISFFEKKSRKQNGVLSWLFESG